MTEKPQSSEDLVNTAIDDCEAATKKLDEETDKVEATGSLDGLSPKPTVKDNPEGGADGK